MKTLILLLGIVLITEAVTSCRKDEPKGPVYFIEQEITRNSNVPYWDGLYGEYVLTTHIWKNKGSAGADILRSFSSVGTVQQLETNKCKDYNTAQQWLDEYIQATQFTPCSDGEIKTEHK